MAGPTPVSALIHAATMVTAGLFIIARCSLLFALAPATLSVIAIVGALTALFAATMGLFQNDIKKVLAYSTVSQLGYMFLAMGCGAFAAGMFHVTTHAFFKALLFLGSGAVIHGMHDEQDMRKMGGLKKFMPITYITFLVATFAISGIPPFSGFFSKDEILWQAYNNSAMLWLLGIVAALCTAFYMWRALTLTFYGKQRFDEHKVHPHEAPKTMTIPLIILAVLSIGAGFIGMPKLFGVTNLFDQWLEPVFAQANEAILIPATGTTGTEIAFMIISVITAAAGIWLAMTIYKSDTKRAVEMKAKVKGLYTLLYNKYYIDEFYQAVIVRPLDVISTGVLWKFFDIGIIDGAVNGLAAFFLRLSGTARKAQSGFVQVYAVSIVVGIIIIVGWFAFFS
jgi:NADH-quinone oxidoreductase subunit L